MQISDTPFSIVAISCFLDPESDESASFREPVTVATLADAFSSLKPAIYIPLPQRLAPEGGITLTFRSMDDFSSQAIVENTPWLRSLNEQASLSSPLKQAKQADYDPLNSLLEMVDIPSAAGSSTIPAEGEEEYPAAVSAVLKRVFADLRFIGINAAWHGLALLFDERLRGNASVSVLPVYQISAVDQITALSSCLADNPPDLLLLDIDIDATTYGMKLLAAASGMAEELMTPLICRCGPAFFSIDSWDGLESLPYLPNHLDGFSYAKWNGLRSGGSALWTSLCCNGFSMLSSSEEKFTAGRPVFTGSLWGVAALMLQALKEKGLPGNAAAIRLSMEQYNISFETEISQERIHQMLECGISPLFQPARGKLGIPALRSVDGSPLSISLGLSRVIHILLRLRSENGPAYDGESLADELQDIFERHLESSACRYPETLTITCSGATERGGVRLSIAAAFSREDGGRRIEFTFDW